MRYGHINCGIFENSDLKREDFKGRTPHIIVIGAGASGLSCARQLHQFGFKVTVLEGRERIGGRCYTSSELGTAVDLGAQIITGKRISK